MLGTTSFVLFLSEVGLEVLELLLEAHVGEDDGSASREEVEGFLHREVLLLHQVRYHQGRAPRDTCVATKYIRLFITSERRLRLCECRPL